MKININNYQSTLCSRLANITVRGYYLEIFSSGVVRNPFSLHHQSFQTFPTHFYTLTTIIQQKNIFPKLSPIHSFSSYFFRLFDYFRLKLFIPFAKQDPARFSVEMEDQSIAQDLAATSSYEAAMEALSSLIGQHKRPNSVASDGTNFPLMLKYIKMLGLEQSINELKIIHVAGTKGKGSTCTFSEAILRECGLRTGLFTSPHLIDVRERIRINGLELSREKFLHYFWDLWNQLKIKLSEELLMPGLFQFLTLLAFKIFLCEKVDVAIIEVGIGGKWDSTNVIKEPVVCGVTSLGMDHMEILGNTIDKIASQKAGIFKPHVPGFTVPQLPKAMLVLQETASRLMIPLEVASALNSKWLKGLKLGLDGDHQLINAGLAVALCKCWLERTGHSSLASNVAMDKDLPEAFRRGLASATLSGRAQIVKDIDSENSSGRGNLVFYLDGAHTPESLNVSARWFCSATFRENSPFVNGDLDSLHGNSHGYEYCNGNGNRSWISLKKILLFNCMEKRDPHLLLPQLIKTCAANDVHFSKAIFVRGLSSHNKVASPTSIVTSDTSVNLSWQSTLQRTWENYIHGTVANVKNGKCSSTINSSSNGFSEENAVESCDPSSNLYNCSSVMLSLPSAIHWLRECAGRNPMIQYQVLVTGSLHLVGDVLKLLRR
ncbi:DHFS-FPGS homolog C isoform X3 [Carex rostrata]